MSRKEEKESQKQLQRVYDAVIHQPLQATLPFFRSMRRWDGLGYLRPRESPYIGDYSVSLLKWFYDPLAEENAFLCSGGTVSDLFLLSQADFENLMYKGGRVYVPSTAIPSDNTRFNWRSFFTGR